ncbi:MAG: ABC transporter ATP-binding protein [Chthonomonas sp.]|nr:ABC transporter ATP-binding protein [Chthonomonas sp.]
MIRIENLSIGYGGRPLASGISFELNPGEILLLLGPNGSGKSTLLRTLLGVVPAVAGRITFHGSDLAAKRSEEIAKLMAFVPQDESVPFEFTAREMVSMGRLVRSGWWADTAEDRQVVDEAMSAQSCAPYADRLISQLSGGERQRVYLARAMAQESPLWLLDEPNSHLDILYQLELEKTIQKCAADGKMIIAAVHDFQMVQRLAAPALVLTDQKCYGPMPLEDLVRAGVLGGAFGVGFRLSESGALETFPAH